MSKKTFVLRFKNLKVKPKNKINRAKYKSNHSKDNSLLLAVRFKINKNKKEVIVERTPGYSFLKTIRHEKSFSEGSNFL
jgi:hypothetical protein